MNEIKNTYHADQVIGHRIFCKLKDEDKRFFLNLATKLIAVKARNKETDINIADIYTETFLLISYNQTVHKKIPSMEEYVAAQNYRK